VGRDREKVKMKDGEKRDSTWEKENQCRSERQDRGTNKGKINRRESGRSEERVKEWESAGDE